jgi:hypothetical protein
LARSPAKGCLQAAGEMDPNFEAIPDGKNGEIKEEIKFALFSNQRDHNFLDSKNYQHKVGI